MRVASSVNPTTTSLADGSIANGRVGNAVHRHGRTAGLEPHGIGPLADSGASHGHGRTPESAFLEALQRAGMAEQPLPKTGADQFAQMLVGEVRGVNAMQHDADTNVHELLTGGDISEAEVLTSIQKADLAFRMLLQVRNKLMDAYREIQQIQI